MRFRCGLVLLCCAAAYAQATCGCGRAGEMESFLSRRLRSDNITARFNSPYSGPFSLQNYPERDVSLTTTLFLGIQLEKNTQLYFDPEIAGGRGFSGVNGLANSSNGELPRVASATPKPYLARLYISHDFGFGSETEVSRER